MIKLIKTSFAREAETKQKLLAFLAESGQLSMGEQCATFEQRFAAWQGRKHCILVNSGSSANLALIQALLNIGRVQRGDGVGFSALTWSTNVMPLIQLGLRAVPVDVELDTLNVSSRTFAAQLAKYHMRMLFLTDLLGWCDDLERIRALCAERGLILIEDACESLGSVYRSTRLGNFGVAATFSFYVSHQFSVVEGGAVCTDDDELANMLRIVRAHGWDRNLDRETQTHLREHHRVASTFYSRYTFYDLGYNLRPTEVTGFLGNAQLPYLDEVIARREANARRLLPMVTARADRYLPLRFDHLDTFSNFAIPVLCRSKRRRDALVAYCEGRVEVRPVVGGDVTQQPFFRRHSGSLAGSLGRSNAAFVHAQGLYFANNPELTEEELAELTRVFTGPVPEVGVVPAATVAAGRGA